MSPLVIQPFFDATTGTVTYLVHAGPGTACAVIDPVLDFDARSGRTGTQSIQPVADAIASLSLRLEWILETHAHADHLSAAAWLQRRLGGRVGIGRPITQVQTVFRELFHLGDACPVDGTPFDHLFDDGEAFRIGDLPARAIAVPGHTPACMAFEVGDAVFVGDTLFMPDVGTARCDFPGGSAETLYRSIRRLLALPPATRLFMCHDYPPPGREVRWECTVAEQRAGNIHVHDGIDEATFVAMRSARDRTLAMPNLMLPSVQVNIRAGHLPEPESNGIAYLRLPIDAL